MYASNSEQQDRHTTYQGARHMDRTQQRTVGILIFDDVEVLDFAGPFEVFASARPIESDSGLERLFRPLIVAEEQRTITCRGGLLVQPHHTLTDHPPLDVIVIPGGHGTRRERLNARVLDWIVAQNQRTEVTTSVCTGAFLLAERGLLDGLQATTHWGSIAWMREQYPAVRMVDDQRFVDQGHIVTAAGVSAGIDMALHVVARLHGEAIAAATARSMEYDRASAALSAG
jgi:transcriptional regulator GlxA family with amidase domain